LKRWRKKHYEQYRKTQKYWEEEHAGQRREKRRLYIKTHPEIVIEWRKQHKLWVKNHPKRVAELNERWRRKNLEKVKKYWRLSRLRHYKKWSEYAARWRLSNPDKIKKYSKRSNFKISQTKDGVLNMRMSSAIRQALHKNKAGRHWETLVGFTLADLKKHIESQFVGGMSWDAFIRGEIHIDHKIPKSRFKYEKPEDAEFKVCWSLGNLQPLWAKDNWKKYNKIPQMQKKAS